MAVATTTLVRERAPQDRTAVQSVLAYFRRNPSLALGLAVILIYLLIGLIGPFFVHVDEAQATAVIPDQAPSSDLPLGSDDQGRNLAAVLVAGLPLTLKIGFIAGAIGVSLGTLFGFIAGYQGGWVDVIIRTATDTLLTVPGLLVLVIVADSIKGVISIELLALIVASLAWMHPTRTIRSQVLSLRERAYVNMARLSGVGWFEIIVKELIPNMLPYLGASFVGAVSGAVLASVGLEALGLGPQNAPDLGMTIYWAISFNALIRSLWWWWAMPIAVIVILFIALFLINQGLDEIANPRRRRAA